MIILTGTKKNHDSDTVTIYCRWHIVNTERFCDDVVKCYDETTFFKFNFDH